MIIDTSFNDTICAPATVPGTGAISLIRLSGPKALEIAGKVLTADISRKQGYSVCYSTILDNDGQLLDEVIVNIYHSPHSYTGEDSVEISCHASSYIVSRIIMLLVDAGARCAVPGEFTRRAFTNGKMDLAQAEAVADLIASENDAAHKVAVNQLKGGFSKELKDLRQQLLELTSLVELELDFAEEEVIFADRSRLLNLTEKAESHIAKLVESFRLGNAVKNGVPVAMIGSTNTGKSTLLNALLQEDRAIVSPVAGTTRDTIEETSVIGDTLFRFIDTAGIRETSEAVEKIGIERALTKVNNAEIVLGVIDTTRSTEEIHKDVEFICSKVDFSNQNLVFLLNKSDISCDNNFVIANNFIVSLTENKEVKPKVLSISAKEGDNLDKLKALLQEIQHNKVSSYNSTLVTNLRHYTALSKALESLKNVHFELISPTPTDLIAEDLRAAISHLGSITGEISTEDILGEIFSKFCIGK